MFSKALQSIHQVQQIRYSSVSKVGPIQRNDFNKFTIAGMRKNYAVLPLVVIIGTAVTGLIGFIVYCSSSRTDISFRRSRETSADRMDMMHPEVNKLLVFNQKYEAMPELADGLKAIKEQ